MSNSRANPAGWSIGDELTSVQMNNVDIGQARAIDKTNETAGSGGGVTGEIDWTSGASIVALSGSSITANSGSTVSFAGTNTISGGLTVSGATTFSNTVGLTNHLNVTTAAGILNLSSSASISLANTTSLTAVAGATVTMQSGSNLTLNGYINYTVTTLGASGTTYTCDSGSNKDYYVLVNTSANFKTITLPVPSVGRTLYFKDISDNAGTKDITITHHASETIDGSANVTMNVGFGVISVISDGTNWYVLHNSGTI